MFNIRSTIFVAFATKTQVSKKSMNHIIMRKGNWKVYVCRYAEQYQCECDFIVCQDCNNKNNSTRSRQYNTDNAPMLQDMFYPLLNKWTGEALCVGNQV